MICSEFAGSTTTVIVSVVERTSECRWRAQLRLSELFVD
jgi:hypothetical protein